MDKENDSNLNELSEEQIKELKESKNEEVVEEITLADTIDIDLLFNKTHGSAKAKKSLEKSRGDSEESGRLKDKVKTSSKGQKLYNKKKKKNSLLDDLININADIKKRKKGKVELLKPIVWRKKQKVLFPNTIMAIQGPSGSGKTRLAQAMVASILTSSNPPTKVNNLGFKTYNDEMITVLIDTERNLNDQMPLAIQEIQYLAGIPREEDPPNLEYTSILNLERKKRLDAIKEYVQHLQDKHEDKHLIIFLDVLSDLVQDFNEPQECLSVIDYLNRLINNHNCTIVCVLHQNPGTTKMRGHLGTELNNKASTVLQITHKENGPADITLRYIKCRNSQRYPDFYAEFDNESRTLKEVDPNQVDKAANNIKATSGEVIRFLSTIGFPISRQEILNELMSEFEISESTAETRLKEVWKGQHPIKQGGENYMLKKNKKGGSLEYQLEPDSKNVSDSS